MRADLSSTAVSLTGTPLTLPGQAPLQLVHRNDLHRVLHDLAAARGIVVAYGSTGDFSARSSGLSVLSGAVGANASLVVFAAAGWAMTSGTPIV